MAAPKTAAEWWSLLGMNRGRIVEIMERVGLTRKQRDKFEAAVVFRDVEEICRLLQLTWENAPDRAEIHSWSGWSVLCDLCSENYLVKEGDAK